MADDLEALRTAYADVSSIALSLSEEESWQATGCLGWAVRDLVFHLLGDAQRAMVALATPATGPVDRDGVTYWSDFSGEVDPDSRGLRALRTMAAAWRLDHLVGTYDETTRAVLTVAERAPLDAPIATQGHVLRAGDLLATLVVEAAVHHLDLVVALDRPGPAAAPLAVARRTLDGLLGRSVPAGWDDAGWALAGTGRRPLSAPEREWLGADAERVPLLR